MTCPPPAPTLGLWFDAPRPNDDASILAEAQRLSAAVDRVSIRLNAGTGDLWRPTWRAEALIDFSFALQEEGLEVRWMLDPKGTLEAIDQTCRDLHHLYGLGAVRGWEASGGVEPCRPELDLEPWTKDFNEGRADRLIDELEAFYPFGVAVNCVPTGKGQLHRYVLAFLADPRVNIVTLQSYLQYQGEGHWTKDRVFRPRGSYLDTCEATAKEIESPDRVVALGQAVHAQNHPAPHPRGIEALKVVRGRMLTLGRSWDCWSRASVDTQAEWDYLAETKAMLRAIRVGAGGVA